MGIQERTAIKVVRSDFTMRQDVLVRLNLKVAKLKAKIDYVPDKLLFVRECFPIWIKEYDNWSKSHEWLALNLLDDLNNELVPRWVRIAIALPGNEQIIVEDKQPGWNTNLSAIKQPVGEF